MKKPTPKAARERAAKALEKTLPAKPARKGRASTTVPDAVLKRAIKALRTRG